MTTLDTLAQEPTVLLTTYRRDGTPVGTAVNVAVQDGRAFVRTFSVAGKLKRIRRNPIVQVAASSLRGRPTGPAIRARARILTDAEAAHASRLIARKHRILHGVLVPLAHRLRGYQTVHLELEALDGT